MRIFLKYGLGIFMVWMLVACANQVVETETEPPVKHDVLVGKVASVNKRDGYVLIRSIKNIPEGGDVILYARDSQGVTHALKLSGQSLGEFVAADLMEPARAVEVGSAVFLRDLSVPRVQVKKEVKVVPMKTEATLPPVDDGPVPSGAEAPGDGEAAGELEGDDELLPVVE